MLKKEWSDVCQCSTLAALPYLSFWECHVENSTRFLNHPGKAECDRPDFDLKLSGGFHLRFYCASIKIERGTESGAQIYCICICFSTSWLIIRSAYSPIIICQYELWCQCGLFVCFPLWEASFSGWAWQRGQQLLRCWENKHNIDKSGESIWKTGY